MKEIDLKPYPIPEIRIADVDPVTGKSEIKVIKEYDVRESLVAILFSRDLQLTAKLLLEREPVARKILDKSISSVILETAEYALIKQAVETIKGYTRNDLDMVRRVLEAPDIAVEKKGK